MSSPDFQVEQEKRCVYIEEWEGGGERERGRRNEKAIVIKCQQLGNLGGVYIGVFYTIVATFE